MKLISPTSPPQFGHTSGNSSPTRTSSFAQAIREVSWEQSLSRDLRRALARARGLGVRGIEIDGRRGVAADQITQTGLRQIRKWLEDEGLVVSAVAFPTRGRYADADRVEARIAATKAALELAHALGAQVVTNHIGDIPPAPAVNADEADPAWQLLIGVLADIGAWGHRVGATLCDEAGRAAPANLLRVIAALPTASLHCDIVTGSLLVHRHDPTAAVETLGSHNGFVHLTDAVAGSYAGRGRPAPLGTGGGRCADGSRGVRGAGLPRLDRA